jgi:uncharacterized protein (DUF2236 family)
VGFQRAVTIEELDPFLLAAVHDTEKVAESPRRRYDATMRYFATVAFGDSHSAVRASEVLVKVHAYYGVGTEPVSGRPYDANDPGQQLWIHLTAWHSILYAYERFGPGRLSDADDRRYWQECAVAAELQTVDPALVPRCREEVRRYFESQRPRLAASEITQQMMDHILDALYDVLAHPLPRAFAPLAWVASRMVRKATVASMPQWQRKLGGIRQWRLTDAAIGPIMRAAFWGFALSTRFQLAALRILSPATVPIIAPILLNTEPADPRTVTPAEAFERDGIRTPIEVYAELRQQAPARYEDQYAAWPHPAAVGNPSRSLAGAGRAVDAAVATTEGSVAAAG